MALVNHTTGNHQMFPARVNWILSNRIKLYAVGAGAVLLILALIALSVSGSVTGGIMPFAFLIGGGVVAWEVFRWLTLYRQVRLEVENVAQSTLQKEKGQTRAA